MRKNIMPGARPGRAMPQAAAAGQDRALFDLGFLEDDVLAGDRVELLQLELVGLGPRVLPGHVEEAGIGAADQLDQDGIGLGHYRLRQNSGLLAAQDKAPAKPVKARPE